MTAAEASKIILNIVEFLGNPISVLRFRPSEFHVQLSTLHSSEFARLDLELFSLPSRNRLFTRLSTLKNIGIVISSGSEKSLTNQYSSSLLFLAMATAKASKIILNIVEFLSPVALVRMIALISRQVDPECGALIRFTGNIDEAVVLFDDTVYRSQSQAGAIAGLFGGKKRFKNFAECLLIHAAAVVVHGQAYEIAGNKPGMFRAVSRVKTCCASFNGNFTHIGDGIPGVDAQIGQDLVQMMGVEQNRPQADSGPPHKLNVFSEELLQNL